MHRGAFRLPPAGGAPPAIAERMARFPPPSKGKFAEQTAEITTAPKQIAPPTMPVAYVKPAAKPKDPEPAPEPQSGVAALLLSQKQQREAEEAFKRDLRQKFEAEERRLRELQKQCEEEEARLLKIRRQQKKAGP